MKARALCIAAAFVAFLSCATAGATGFMVCSDALAALGRPAGPVMGTPDDSLHLLGLIDADAAAFYLGSGSMADAYRVLNADGSEVAFKHYPLDAPGYALSEIDEDDIPATRQMWIEADIRAYELFASLLPQLPAEESFSASRMLRDDRANANLVLTFSRGQVLKRVVKALGWTHPTVIELGRLYTLRVNHLYGLLLERDDVTDLHLGKGPFPELVFTYLGEEYVIDVQSVLLDTQTHTMSIFDPV